MKNETPSALISGAMRGALAQRPVGEPLDGDAEEAAADHRPEEHQHDQEPHRNARVLRAAEPAETPQPMKAPDHEHVAVREVQELQDPVDHREPERNERVDAPEREPADEELDELVPVHARVISQFVARGRAARPREGAPLRLGTLSTSRRGCTSRS